MKQNDRINQLGSNCDLHWSKSSHETAELSPLHPFSYSKHDEKMSNHI